MNTPSTNPTTVLSRLAHYSRMIRGSLGVSFSAGLTVALLLVVFMGGCKEESPGIVNVCITPTVIRTSPDNGATNVPLNKTGNAIASASVTGVKKIVATSKTSDITGSASDAGVKVISATFNTPMDPNSITTTTFTVRQGGTPISGTVSYSDTTALFVVPNGLQPNLTYNCTITTGAKDVAGTALASNYPWSFTTVLTYTATLSSSPAAGGTTSGGGTFNSGSSVTVTAAPNTGYTFTNWTESGTVVSTNASYTFTISGNRTLAANFTAIPQYTVTLSSSPAAGGAAGGGGTFSSGSSVAVTATPNTGYTFTNWTENGTAVSTNASYTFTISGNRTLAANFAINTYTLTTTAVNGTVTKNPNQTNYNYGSNVTLTATPSTGYTFTNWSGDITSSTNPLTVTMNGNKSITANFTAIAQYTVTLSSSPAAGGTASGGGTFYSGASVTVIATPNAGYTFTNWTANGVVVTSSISYQFTISGNRTLVANFTAIPPAQYTVTLLSIPSAGGTTSGSGVFNSGASVTVSATPNAGYTFTNWTEGGTVITTNASYTFTISGNRTLVANFTAIPPTQYTVTLSSIPVAGGTTSGGGTFNSGSSVTVIATPNAGYTFTNWTESGTVVTSSINYQFTISGNRTLVANFTAIPPTQYAVTLLSSPLAGGIVTQSGTGTYNSGSSVTVTATPNAGYTFTNWTESGTAVSTTAGYTFTISGNRTLVANFTAIAPTQYTVTLSSIPSAGGTTTGSGTFNSGSSVTVTAAPNAGYTFTNWTESGTVVTSSISYTFTISGNRTLVANFTAVPPAQYTVTLLSIPAEGGTTSGGGVFNSGSSVTVTAAANAGYKFTNWTESGIAVSTSASYTFTISGNRTLVANYIVGPGGLPVNLGSAGNFAVLAGSGISNTGVTTHLYGDVGSFPTATIVGLLSGNVTGTLYTAADPIVGTAKTDLTTAYNDAQGRSLNAISLPGQLGGLTLAPGLYVNSSSSGISGTGSNAILTLDAGGDANAVWVFKMGSTLITDPGTSIVLAGGANWKNIFWSVGSSATLGTNSIFYGNILADQAITLTTGAVLNGRALTRIAAVTLDASIVDKR